MKKIYHIEVDCASCADKIQRSVAKIPGVEAVTVNFLTQKMKLEAAEDRLEELLPQIRRAAKKIEPDCVIGE